MTDKAFDPNLERMVKAGLNGDEGWGAKQTQPPFRVAGDTWMVCGGCPQCGAPIWFQPAAPASARPPQHIYTCPCTALQHRRAARELSLDVAEHPTQGGGHGQPQGSA